MIAPEKLLEAAKALEPQLQEWRRTLHRHPEVGFDQIGRASCRERV